MHVNLDLRKVITNKNLKKLTDANDATIKAALLKANPKLDINEIKLTVSRVLSTYAVEKVYYNVKVGAKDKSLLYFYEVNDVTFYLEDTIVTKKEVKDELQKLITYGTWNTIEKLTKAVLKIETKSFEVKDVRFTEKGIYDETTTYLQAFMAKLNPKPRYVLDNDIKNEVEGFATVKMPIINFAEVQNDINDIAKKKVYSSYYALVDDIEKILNSDKWKDKIKIVGKVEISQKPNLKDTTEPYGTEYVMYYRFEIKVNEFFLSTGTNIMSGKIKLNN